MEEFRKPVNIFFKFGTEEHFCPYKLATARVMVQ
jgi:hypothetical protein